MHALPATHSLLVRRTLTALGGAALVWGVGVLAAGGASAAPARQVVEAIKQPDGTTFAGQIWGDEWNSGVETADGYTVVKTSSGQWQYATRDRDGYATPSGRVAGRDRPSSGTPKHLRDAEPAQEPAGSPNLRTAGVKSSAHTGSQPLLVILAQFTNVSGTTTEAAWADKMFGPSGSVNDFYADASYGSFQFGQAAETFGPDNGAAADNNGIVGWVTLPIAHPNDPEGSGANDRLIVSNAITAADPHVDFEAFDTNNDGVVTTEELHIIVIAAGGERSYTASPCAATVWGHNWELASPQTVDTVKVGAWDSATDESGSYSMFGERHCSTTPGDDHMATVGIMAHELGHDIDLPDMYDVNGGSFGTGSWSLMGYGSWGTSPGGLEGDSPSMLDPFSKSYQGWLTPTQVVGPLTSVPLGSSYSAPVAWRLGNNPNGVDWAFQSAGNTAGTGEYFLVENRGLTGYDQGLPGCGVLVWHVDETRPPHNGTNADQTRRLVTVVTGHNFTTDVGEATDPLSGSSTRLALDGSTVPNSNWYAATPGGTAASTASGYGVTAASTAGNCEASIPVTIATPAGHDLTVTKAGDGNGLVKTLDNAVHCGATCTKNMIPGAEVTLVAARNSVSTFTGWGGDCAGFGTATTCTLTMSAAKNVVATFVDPPNVTLTGPAAVTAPVWTAVFDENVGPITTSSFAVRKDTSAGPAVTGGTLLCRDGELTLVSCAGTSTRLAKLTLPNPLTPGQTYVGRINGVGSGFIRDASANKAPLTNLATKLLTAQAEGGPTAYGWGTVSNAAAHGGSYTTERLVGARATYKFTGSAITWFTVTSPSQGKYEVWIDGVKKPTNAGNPGSNYSTGTQYKIGRAFTDLTNAAHTIEIRVLGQNGTGGGSAVAVDGFSVNGGAVTPAAVYTWPTATLSSPSATIARSDQAGAAIALTFKGTKATIYRLVGPTQGKMGVQLDTGAVVVVDNYAATTSIQPYVTSTVAAGTHKVRVTVLKLKHASSTGYVVSLDSWKVA